MKEQELVEELKKLRSEIAEVKSNIKSFTDRANKPPSAGLNKRLEKMSMEGNLLALLFGVTGFGVAVLLYAGDILNQAIDFKPPVWFGYLGVGIGIFLMIVPAYIVAKAVEKK